MQNNWHGVIEHMDADRKADYLYRVSMKGIVFDDIGRVLMVKENGREWWDLPGGGMDHGESIKAAIAREMKEEVSLQGDFSYRIVHVDEPMILERKNILQIRLVFLIRPEKLDFSPGNDADEVTFLSLDELQAIDPDKYEYLKMILDKI